METYTPLKPFEEHRRYSQQRTSVLKELKQAQLDVPVAAIVQGFAQLSYCFPLQSCLGHFCYPGQTDPHNLAPLPADPLEVDVTYRIAYLALCIEHSAEGEALLQDLLGLVHIDPDYVQVGCADWFWKQYPNSYIVQVEPKRFQDKDQVKVSWREACLIAKRSSQVWGRLASVCGIFRRKPTKKPRR